MSDMCPRPAHERDMATTGETGPVSADAAPSRDDAVDGPTTRRARLTTRPGRVRERGSRGSFVVTGHLPQGYSSRAFTFPAGRASRHAPVSVSRFAVAALWATFSSRPVPEPATSPRVTANAAFTVPAVCRAS